ncbi:hypothetical protein [Sphingopyxis sp.]|uniref:hypothetical protein n=1 Tax=Sphingopyxis sp. TaxID=1908224 RepID=UPI003BAA894F
MVWAIIALLLAAVLIVKLTKGAIPGITRGGQARHETPRDSGGSDYSPPSMITGDSAATPVCDVDDPAGGEDGADCGGDSDGGSDSGGDGGGDGGGSD